MSNTHTPHASRRLVAFAWAVTAIAVLRAAAYYDALTGAGYWGTCASLVIALAFALAALSVEFGVPGARTRVVGSGAATAGAVVALVAVHGNGAAEVVWTAVLVAVAGLSAIVGDAASGARPGRDAVRLAVSTSATVGLFLVAPVIAYLTGF